MIHRNIRKALTSIQAHKEEIQLLQYRLLLSSKLILSTEDYLAILSDQLPVLVNGLASSRILAELCLLIIKQLKENSKEAKIENRIRELIEYKIKTMQQSPDAYVLLFQVLDSKTLA